MEATTVILITLVVYKIALLAFGFWGQTRTKDAADFYLAGGKLGPMVAAISAAASSSSAWTILGVSGAAYKWGLGALWIFPGCVGGFVLNWLVLARRMRSAARATGALTVTELLAGGAGRKGNRAILWFGSAVILVSLGLYVSAQFQAAGTTFAETFDMDQRVSILLGAGIVVVYTLMGGFWAASLTDTLQGVLMALTAIALPVAALIRVEGLEALWQGLEAQSTAHPELSLLDWTHGAEGIMGLGFVLGLLGIGLGYPGQPHVVNRLMALRDGENSLRNARIIALTWAVLVYSGMLLLGLCGRVLYPELAANEGVFIHAVTDLFSPVVAGLMLAAILSAIMSTADSQLLVAGSTVTHDLGWAGTHQKGLMLRTRAAVLALSAIAMVAALFTEQEIFNKVLFAWSALGATFGPALLVTVLRARPAPSVILASMVVGFVTSIAAFMMKLPPESKAIERVLPFVAALVIALLGKRAQP